MLTEQDLIKMATEPDVEDLRNKKSPIRNAYDAVVEGAKTGVGAIGAGVSGLASLDNVKPPRIIA